jgi:deoxyxylulose-5-phosphate synthase
MAANRRVKRILNLGLPDGYIEQSTQAEQLKSVGLDVESILERINEYMADSGLE